MKRLLLILTIAIVLLSQWHNSIVALNYEVNHQYYSEVLCENQALPELNCEGKCAFTEQMNLAQDDPAKTEAPVLLPTLRLFSADIYGFEPSFIAEIHNKTLSNTETMPSSPYISKIAPPPRWTA